MKLQHCLLVSIVLGITILAPACASMTPFLTASTATPTATLTPSPPPPTSTPPPTLTPTATPVPTPDAAAADNVARAGLAAVQTRLGDAALLCLRYEDTDADGTPEWLAVFQQPTTPPA
ncbi:MAG TPA: hypothetical protein PLH19_12525 [Anaerolineae bacterium]|nr:hypothetical protein [Anaerolineae bacterium]